MAKSENPFPGMNPFLERSWRDVHSSLTIYTRDLLQDSLPEPLVARVEGRVFLEDFPSGKRRDFSPDVVVVERPQWETDEGGGTATATRKTAKPIKYSVAPMKTTQRFLEILDTTDGNRLVTMIEFLSKSNKVSGEGRDQYCRKRRDCQKAGVNVVEIDFQRRGRPTTLAHEFLLNSDTPPPYHASVWRASDDETVEAYPMPLRDPLPLLPIPLRADDDDALLDLQKLIDLAYLHGHYSSDAYRKEPEPPFNDADTAWIASLLAEKNLRNE